MELREVQQPKQNRRQRERQEYATSASHDVPNMRAEGDQEDADRRTGRLRDAASRDGAECNCDQQHTDVAELFDDGAQSGFLASRRRNVRQHGRLREITKLGRNDEIERRRGEDLAQRLDERDRRERPNKQLPAPRGNERLRNKEQEGPGERRQLHLRRMSSDQAPVGGAHQRRAENDGDQHLRGEYEASSHRLGLACRGGRPQCRRSEIASDLDPPLTIEKLDILAEVAPRLPEPAVKDVGGGGVGGLQIGRKGQPRNTNAGVRQFDDVMNFPRCAAYESSRQPNRRRPPGGDDAALQQFAEHGTSRRAE